MKRFITIFVAAVCAFSIVTSCGNTVSGKNSKNEIRSLVREYEKKSGFDAVNIGPLMMSLAKSCSGVLDDDDESKLIKSSIEKLSGVTVVDFSDCKTVVRDEFRKKLSGLLEKNELLVETKDDGETVLIYGQTEDDGNSVKNLVIYMPEDCELVCLWGSVNIADVMDYAKSQD